jgi:predicted DNA-binding transcriptional regulator AlpA
MSRHPTQSATPPRRLLDVAAVAALYGLSRRTVFRLADAGVIPFGVHVGRSRRWDAIELDRHISGGCRTTRKDR